MTSLRTQGRRLVVAFLASCLVGCLNELAVGLVREVDAAASNADGGVRDAATPHEPDAGREPDAGTDAGPCSESDCVFVVTFGVQEGDQEFGCADGQEPICTRDRHGYCGYECPPDGRCSLEQPECGEESFCVFKLGTCGLNGESALCQRRSEVCPLIHDPVCGCDQKEYGNSCLAFQSGVSVAFNGPCNHAPEPCDECPSATFAVTGEMCSDGVHRSGQACVHKPDGDCAYQWLACPPEPE